MLGKRSLLSPAYIIMPKAICLLLLMHLAALALSFALARAGSNIAARMAIMAMTTSSSIRVKALLFVDCFIFISLFRMLSPRAQRAPAQLVFRHPCTLLNEQAIKPVALSCLVGHKLVRAYSWHRGQQLPTEVG